MTDRELLELAAKAASIIGKFDGYVWSDTHGIATQGASMVGEWWNPFTDDGDAFRLSTFLHMNVDITCAGTVIRFPIEVEGENYLHVVDETFLAHKGDRNACTRRAIVRAAAAIGKSIKYQGAT